MTNEDRNEANVAVFGEQSFLRRKMLARWDNEGGRIFEDTSHTAAMQPIRKLTNAELVQLQMRMIALENIMVALLASKSDAVLTQVRELAAVISPRPESVQHTLTINAANQMLHLVGRAQIIRDSAWCALNPSSESQSVFTQSQQTMPSDVRWKMHATNNRQGSK